MNKRKNKRNNREINLSLLTVNGMKNFVIFSKLAIGNTKVFIRFHNHGL